MFPYERLNPFTPHTKNSTPFTQMFPYERLNPFYSSYEKTQPLLLKCSHTKDPTLKCSHMKDSTPFTPHTKNTTPFTQMFPYKRPNSFYSNLAAVYVEIFYLNFFFPKNHPNHLKRRLTHSTLSFFIIPFSLYPFFIIPLSLFPFRKDLTFFIQMTSFYKKINYERLNPFRRKIF